MHFSHVRYFACAIIGLLFVFSTKSSIGAEPIPATNSVLWANSYVGKSTNEFFADRRSMALITFSVPSNIIENVTESLGGPPNPVIRPKHGQLFASACAPRNCLQKGFVWLDIEKKVGLGGYVSNGTLNVGSKQLNASELPPDALRAIHNWVGENDVPFESVLFYFDKQKAKTLQAKDFKNSLAYIPKPSGPSFECKRALTPVEKEICASKSLSTADLELSNLAKMIRQSHSTSSARQQLKSVQKNWLIARDAKCIKQTDVTDCLSKMYEQQNEFLRNWTPSQQTRF
ncbi:lysozyme inhibitor LprI family protein [Massilia sp. UBA6681]|uniref:lysozyme inhibitor LprI family protein n=1 Tax=Massilia sp. UBA6681 TaxID=1946839 RepID=UPI0025C0C188|nr:lysozyme inhibitor LprI family protein [Massilia sp. UBA6681]